MSSTTPTPTPTQEMQQLARRQQRLLDEHAHTLPTGLVMELYEIAMLLHEGAPRWVDHAPAPDTERWVTDDMVWQRELEYGRATEHEIDWDAELAAWRALNQAKEEEAQARAGVVSPFRSARVVA